MTLFTLILVGLLYTVASVATYTQSFRLTYYYLAVMLVIALLSALLWTLTVQRQATNSEIAFLSLVWDFTIVLVYSVIPMLIFSKQAGWQFWFALSLSVFGMMWMKILLEDK